MNKKILKISFSKLRKLEVKNLARRVIETVDGYDPETLKIKEIYDLLVEMEPQIEFLDVGYGPHPISPHLNELRRKRRAIGQGIVDQMKSLENGKMIGTEKDVEFAKRFVTRYLQGVWGKDDVTIHEKVALFFQHYLNDAELQDAFNSLNLTSYLDSLKSVNKTIEEQYNVRRKNVSERPKAVTPGIVSDLETALGYLFRQIEVAHKKNKGLDYTSLIDDLNQEIANYKAIIKTRASYNKRKAEEVIIDGNSEEPSEPTESANKMLMRSMNVDEVQEDNQNELDTKKAVAMPTRQTRLPDVSTEA